MLPVSAAVDASWTALNSRSWDRPFLVRGPWRAPHRSLWEEAAEEQPWQPKACKQTPGLYLEHFVGAQSVGHTRQWLVTFVPWGGDPNLSALNHILPCNSGTSSAFAQQSHPALLSAPCVSSFKEKRVQGAGKRQCMDTRTKCHHSLFFVFCPHPFPDAVHCNVQFTKCTQPLCWDLNSAVLKLPWNLPVTFQSKWLLLRENKKQWLEERIKALTNL